MAMEHKQLDEEEAKKSIGSHHEMQSKLKGLFLVYLFMEDVQGLPDTTHHILRWEKDLEDGSEM